MMKKFLFLLLIDIIIGSSAEAQKDLRPGYVVLNSGDTIRGYIDYRGDLNNSSKCTFYREPASEPEIYMPGEITSYRFENGRYYVSRNFTVNNAPVIAFLEYLVNGISSLYYLRNETGDYYFIEKDGEIYQLSHGISIVSDGEKKYFKQSNLYIGQLKVIYSEAPDLMPRINTARFDRSTMMKLSEDYHNTICTDRSCIVYAKESKGSNFKFGPALRYDIITVRYKDFMADFKHIHDQSFKLGGSMIIQLSGVNEKLNLEVNLFAGRERLHGFYEGTVFGPDKYTYNIDVEKTKISLNPGFKYFYPSKKKVRPTASLGLEYSQVIAQNSKYVISHYTNDVFLSEIVRNDIIDNKYDIGMTGTLGIVSGIKEYELNLDMWVKAGGAFYREHSTLVSGKYPTDVSYYSRLICFGLRTAFCF